MALVLSKEDSSDTQQRGRFWYSAKRTVLALSKEDGSGTQQEDGPGTQQEDDPGTLQRGRF